MSKLLISTVIYSVLLICGLVTFFLFSNENSINITEGKENIRLLKYALEKNEHNGHEDHDYEEDEAGYHYDNEFVKIFQDIEQTLSFFVAVLIEENEEFFTSFFIPQQYSDDLWAYSDDPYFENANYKIMKEFNRDGTLVSARYETNIKDGYRRSREDSDVTLILSYEDGKEVRLILDLVLIGTEHNIRDNIYFINNSVIDLLKEVKYQTK